MSGTVAPRPGNGRRRFPHPQLLARASRRRTRQLFSSPPWIRAVCDTYGFSPKARIVTDEIGGATNGFAWVPISDLHGDRTVSMPFSDRADPIVADPARGRRWSKMRCWSMRHCGFGASTMQHRLPTPGSSGGRGRVAGTPLGVTTWELHDKISTRGRRDIATAQRRGARVDALDGIDAAVSTTGCTCHCASTSTGNSRSRWNSSNELAGVQRDHCIVTLVASVDDEPSRPRSIWSGTVRYYKFGASLAAGLSACPNDALAWVASCWATERGLRLLDWGLSDLGQPGLIAFKHKWASEERRIVTVRSEHQSFELARAGRVLASRPVCSPRTLSPIASPSWAVRSSPVLRMQTIVHISADFPDPFGPTRPRRWRPCRRAPGFRHIVYSLNRVSGLSVSPASRFDQDRVCLIYRAPPWSLPFGAGSRTSPMNSGRPRLRRVPPMSFTPTSSPSKV